MSPYELVALMRVEAARAEDENYHSAAILLREGAEQLMAMANEARQRRGEASANGAAASVSDGERRFQPSTVTATDGSTHKFNASSCVNSSNPATTANDRFWGVWNDCQGFFSIHADRSDAEGEALRLNADCHVIPVVVFADISAFRNLSAA